MRVKATLVCGLAAIISAICSTACANTADISESEKPIEAVDRSQKSSAMMNGLIKLIESSRSISDFTPERLAFYLKTTIRHGDANNYGSLEEITDQWLLAVAVNLGSANGPRFELYFQDVPLNSSPPMTRICNPDFERFTSSLEKSGFSRDKYYGLHGSLGWDSFSDNRTSGRKLTIEVYPLGEADEPADLIGHLCIKRIVIQ